MIGRDRLARGTSDVAVAPGEYVFTCGECDGKGEIEVGDRDYGDHEWVRCPDCNGDGVLHVDEDQAAELIDCGAWPPRAPDGYSEE
jgi:DnaJ-class molecular chaperone